MSVSYISSVSSSSIAHAIINSLALTGPGGILDHTVVETANKQESHNMMIEAWVNRMI